MKVRNLPHVTPLFYQSERKLIKYFSYTDILEATSY